MWRFAKRGWRIVYQMKRRDNMRTKPINRVVYLARKIHHFRGASLCLRHHSAFASFTNTGSIRSVTKSTVMSNSYAIDSLSGKLSRLVQAAANEQGLDLIEKPTNAPYSFLWSVTFGSVRSVVVPKVSTSVSLVTIYSMENCSKAFMLDIIVRPGESSLKRKSRLHPGNLGEVVDSGQRQV